ncbi:MAG: hypothetical protein JXA49_07930 [Actinobacteria bacterium]|nr:hypothetical protein [Actinomycetota bacterium]
MKIEHLEVPQASVNQFRGPAAGAEGPIVFIETCGFKSPESGISRNAGSGYPSTDYNNVEGVRFEFRYRFTSGGLYGSSPSGISLKIRMVSIFTGIIEPYYKSSTFFALCTVNPAFHEVPHHIYVRDSSPRQISSTFSPALSTPGIATPDLQPGSIQGRDMTVGKGLARLVNIGLQV